VSVSIVGCSGKYVSVACNVLDPHLSSVQPFLFEFTFFCFERVCFRAVCSRVLYNLIFVKYYKLISIMYQFVFVHHESIWGNAGIALFIHNHHTRWR
jgi:hypothetical protein